MVQILKQEDLPVSGLVKDFKKQWEVITRGVAEIVPEEELAKKLKRSLEQD